LLRHHLTKIPSARVEIQHCSRLTEALKLLDEAKTSFDFILLDLGLPDSRGLETFAKVQQHAPKIPIMVLSDSDEENLAIHAVGQGAQDYLVKGKVDGDSLVRAMRYSIERLRIEEELRQARDELEVRVHDRTAELNLGNQILQTEVEEHRLTAEQLGQERESLAHLTRLYVVLSKVNEAIVRLREPEEIYRQLCRIAVEEGLFRMAWVGLVNPDTLLVKPVARWGVEEGYLSNITISAADVPEGRGPIGTAIRTGNYVICNDLETASSMGPWKKRAGKSGYRSSAAFPIRMQGRIIGAFALDAGEPHFFTADRIKLLAALAKDLSFALTAMEQDNQRRRAEKELVQTLETLRRTLEQSMGALSAALEMRDPYTAGHQLRVNDLSCAIAKELQLSPTRIEGLKVAALIHDIGKICVPTEILSKPGKLTSIEMSLIKTHSQAGHDILMGVEFPWPIGQIILQHHERLDGSGYPQGLSGAEILLEARIIAVADVVEAMVSHRPYRAALGIDKALEEIARGKGALYDPEVADACTRLFSAQGYTFSF
jgi:HD-GYP domain-containing protein (c-di-GMP phosphodiesterase class II)/DNA-binding response OmpR family regulator